MGLPFVILELDRPRTLKLGMKAIIEFEKVTGKKIVELDSNASFEVYAQLLYVMLKQEDNDLTLDSTMILIDNYATDLTTVVEAIGEAIQVAFVKTTAPNVKAKLKK